MIIKSNKKQVTFKSKNPQKVEEAVALGKKLSKTPDITKVSVANQMFALIHDESREVIAKSNRNNMSRRVHQINLPERAR